MESGLHGAHNGAVAMKTAPVMGFNVHLCDSCQLQHIHMKELQAIIGDDGVGAVIIEVMWSLYTFGSSRQADDANLWLLKKRELVASHSLKIQWIARAEIWSAK